MQVDTDHSNQQVLNRLVEDSPTQEHVPHMRDMDVALHTPISGLPNQPFGFNVPQGSPHVFDRNGALGAYKTQVQGIAPLGFNAPNVNFHEMTMHQRGGKGGFSDDDEYGQSPGKRKLDDVMQRQQHSNREKKRRNEMNEAIEALKLLLPQSDKNRFRVTKVSVLNEAIEYIQRIKELCMILAKDKRELHDDNQRLHQQLASLGKDVGEPRRWDDRNLMETLQTSKRDGPFAPNGRMDYQGEFPPHQPGGPGFPFGVPGPLGHPGMPPHLGVPFGHPGMPPMMGHPGAMRMPGRGGPMPPHLGPGMEFNPLGYPFFPPGNRPPDGPNPGAQMDPNQFANPNFPGEGQALNQEGEGVGQEGQQIGHSDQGHLTGHEDGQLEGDLHDQIKGENQNQEQGDPGLDAPTSNEGVIGEEIQNAS
jgi:hypothetical protein